MRQDIRLFLGDREVEFNATPQILYTWTETDIRVPSTVKNSFSRTIKVEGTKKNNDTFGHFWNLEREQDYAGQVGPGFNPLHKTDFTLYVGGALYEKGYAKLNSIENDGKGGLTYDITLFGNLGSFLSRLSYQQNTDDDVKLTLADLDYNYVDPGIESTLQEWTMNKDEVWNAWGTICSYGDTNSARYRLIQYVPTYGGTPENFSADKILINYKDGLPTDIFRDQVIDGNDQYTPVNGYALGNFDGDLTPWTTFDLRSYMMTPAIKLKYVIDACGNPAINGGFELDKDSHFFNSNNPYYNDSWMTLGSIPSLNIEETSTQVISGTPTLVRQSGSRSGDLFNVSYTGGNISKKSNVRFTFNLGFTPSDSTNATTLYTDTDFTYIINSYDTQKYISAGGCIVQLWAMDANNNIVSTSNAYLLGSKKQKAHSPNTALWWNYYNSDELDYMAPYTFVEGKFVKKSGSFVFCDRNGNTIDLPFRLNNNVVFDHLVMKIKWPYSYYLQNAKEGNLNYGWYYYPDAARPNMDNFYEVNSTGFPCYTTEEVTGNTRKTISELLSYNRVRGSFNYALKNFEIQEDSYGEFLSGVKLNKKLILGGEMTPADVLLSFAKAFGLYFYYDPSEQASDPVAAPNGIIHLMDRNTFFTDEKVNIENLIDYSKTNTITPTVAASKWLSFNWEQIDSQANNDHRQKYGYDYGRQLVNTSYNYDLSTVDLYDGNCFKGGVMVREKNPLYNYAGTSYGGEENVDYTFPAYIGSNRLTYSLFNGDKSTEVAVGGSIATIGNLNTVGLKNYDFLPKLQAHSEDNNPSDGSGVLLFLNGSYNLAGQFRYWNVDHYDYMDFPFYYWITDDVETMNVINDGSPCYIFTLSEFDINNNRIARKISAIPNFTRDWIPGPQQEGYIVHSWNFGHPQETYVPNVFSTEGDSIYDKMFASYISDLYDVNTKQFTAYVKFPNVDVSMLRKYYWLKNGLWRLNKICDADINSYDTVKCEFIKIQDPENYKLDQITAGGTYWLRLDTNEIEASGGTIGGTVYIQGGGRWYRGDVVKWTYANGQTGATASDSWVSPSTSTGQTSRLTVTVPPNSSSYTKYITVYVEYEDYPPMAATIQQAASAATPVLEFLPQSQDNVIGVSGTTSHTLYYYSVGVVPTSVTATTDSLWLKIISTDTTNKTVTVSAATSTMPYQRTSQIVLNGITVGGAVINNYTEIHQQGGAIDVYPDSITFDYNSSSGKTITVDTDIQWTAEINDNQ